MLIKYSGNRIIGNQEYSIKGATRTSRGTGMIHHPTATILSAQKVVLTVMENKKHLINIIREELQNDKDFIDSFSYEHTLLITGGGPDEITRT